MDPLMPDLCILDSSVPRDRQQCILKATKQAKACQSSTPRQTDDSRLRDERTACEEGQISHNVNRCILEIAGSAILAQGRTECPSAVYFMYCDAAELPWPTHFPQT